MYPIIIPVIKSNGEMINSRYVIFKENVLYISNNTVDRQIPNITLYTFVL